MLNSIPFYESFMYSTLHGDLKLFPNFGILKRIQLQTYVSFVVHVNTFLKGENISKARVAASLASLPSRII